MTTTHAEDTTRTTPTGPGTPAPDPRPALAHALDQAGRLVHTVTLDDLDRPTPCSDYTVRQLLGHLVAVERRIVHISHGGRPDDTTRLATDVADADWPGAWDLARVDLDAVMDEDGILDRTFAHPAGQFPARQAIFAYVSEVAVHTWDLSRAIASPIPLDDDLAAATLGSVTAFLPAEPRGGGIPFGPVVAVGAEAEATAYDRLVAWMGRDPGWTPAT